MAAAVAAAICGCSSGAGGSGKVKEPSRLSEQDTGSVPWRESYEAAAKEARESGKPLMVDVGTSWCTFCKLLDRTVFSRADVEQASQALVPVKVDGDKRPDLRTQWGVKSYPTIIFFTAEGEEIERVLGAVGYEVMLEAMARAAARAESSEGG